MAGRVGATKMLEMLPLRFPSLPAKSWRTQTSEIHPTPSSPALTPGNSVFYSQGPLSCGSSVFYIVTP